ncbi:MAG: hypothetical protein N2205_09475 [Candidatus Caldatribacterium sp.]|nr:hypothetical protein [Candidatus Caldatribacterium sp.]
MSRPGVCMTWEEAKAYFPVVLGNEDIVRDIWERIEYWSWLFVWHGLLSF